MLESVCLERRTGFCLFLSGADLLLSESGFEGMEMKVVSGVVEGLFVRLFLLPLSRSFTSFLYSGPFLSYLFRMM